MNTNPQPKPNRNYIHVMWAAVTLAITTAIVYVLIALNILSVGDLQTGDKPPVIIFVAAGCYLLGGLLILTRKGGLLIFGATINALVILFFYKMYQGRLAVMLSPGGLVSKVVQILLEIALLYIIIVQWKKSPSN
jgi:hypothetical protein